MLDELKHYGSEIKIFLSDYCDILEEHYYHNPRLNMQHCYAWEGWIKIDWIGQEYTIRLGISPDLEPCVLIDEDGDWYESGLDHVWYAIAYQCRTKNFCKEQQK